MAQRFQQTRGGEDGDLVRLETEIPGRLTGVQARRGDLPVQKLGLLLDSIHATQDQSSGGTSWCIADTIEILAGMHGAACGRCQFCLGRS